MLGFDRELRLRGFAGNSCQIILNLETRVSPEALEDRVRVVCRQHPLATARLKGHSKPRWRSLENPFSTPQVRLHRDDPGVLDQLLNEPLAPRDGRLMRFDLIERSGDRMDLVFTWTHPLMDAVGAEHFLAMVGGTAPVEMPAAAPRPARPSLPFFRRVRLAWQYLYYVDHLASVAPRSIPQRFPDAPAELRHRTERFSKEETGRIRSNGVRHCGPLAEAQHRAAVAALELHALHQRLQRPSPSYVLPITVSQRLKGSPDPLFGNQIAILMSQLLPGHLASVKDVASALKSQTIQALRSGLLDSGQMLSDLFRFLPLPIYMAILKRGMKGEICSLFLGDTAAVNPLLERFLDVTVLDFTHVAAVTPSPGLGVVFYSFRGALRATVTYSAQRFTDQEATDYAHSLRHRLLES